MWEKRVAVHAADDRVVRRTPDGHVPAISGPERVRAVSVRAAGTAVHLNS
jgi:hypothetical protein